MKLTKLAAITAAAAMVLMPCKAQEHQWKAGWITKESCHTGTNTWLAFRKSVKLDKAPESVTARIACDSKYWMWINGEPAVFEGGLKRGPAPGDSYYDKVEIAKFLKEGENEISILMWYFGKNGFSHMSSGVPALLFEATGDGVEILSDDSWKTLEQTGYGTMTSHEPNYRLCESDLRYDARKMDFDWFRKPVEMGGAMTLGFAPGSAPMGKLVERPIPQWKTSGIREYESITRSGDTLVCRLPYNCQVTPYLKVNSPEGKCIRMETDHSFITGSEGIRAEYVTKSGIQEYESLGWINGDIMYYIVPDSVEIIKLGYRESGYDTEFEGSFRCDDEFLNEYWKRAARTLYVCMRDTYYDCPDRERAQWWGDEVDELATAFYALSPSSWKLARKGMLELVSWQRSDGALFSPVPAANWSRDLPLQILASVGMYGFYHYYFMSGDSSFIERTYEPVHKYLHGVWKRDSEGMPEYYGGDWDWPDGSGGSDCVPLMTCWYALALQAEARFADMTGRTADAEQDREMLSKIAEGFEKRYWNGKEYRSSDRTGPADDRVQALAVLAGFAGEDRYPEMAAAIEANCSASTYMHRFIFEALYRMGRADIAVKRMHEMYPTVMQDGVTTLFEHWNHSGSMNHAWTSSGIVMAGKYMAGISPIEPGFRKFKVSPQLGPLNEVDCSVATKYGKIIVSIRRSGKALKISLTVPDGTEAVTGDGRTFGPGTHSLALN